MLRAVLVLAGLLVALAACDRPSTAPAPEPARQDHAHDKPSFVHGELPVAPFVAEAQLAAPGARTVVYVGASWCEPCQRFHRALEAGELDAQLTGMRFVEYDLDAAKPQLDEAGYGSRLIPLFALPGADGRASSARIEGSIKGERAVQDNLLPRLLQLGR